MPWERRRRHDPVDSWESVRQARPYWEPASRRSRWRGLALVVPIGAIISIAVLMGLGGLVPSGAPNGDPGTRSHPASASASTPLGPSAGSPSGTSPSAQPSGATTPPTSGAPPEPSPSEPTSLEPEELTGYLWPARHGRVTGWFAKRDDGFMVVDGMRIHEGLDIATFCGDHVRAAHDGVVLAAGRRAAAQMGFSEPVDELLDEMERGGRLRYFSITVVIDDGNGYRSVYAHLAEPLVAPGDVVEAGDRIGIQGMTGNATGCHLHYELIRMDGSWMTVAQAFVRRYGYPPFARERIDPMRVLSLDRKGAPSYVPGIPPPKTSPGLGRPTAPRPPPSPDPSASPDSAGLADPSAPREPSPSPDLSASPSPDGD